MKTVYNMSTGQVEETTVVADDAQGLTTGAYAEQLQLRLQPVSNESIPERGLPPELVLADLNAFLDKMR